MLVSGRQNRRAARESGASPERSRRCEGRRSRANTPLAHGLGRRRREGTPSQKTSAAGTPEPLAEGGFVFRLVLFVAAFAALLVVGPASAAVPQRIVSLSPTATESLFAIGAGKEVVAVDELSDY